MKPTIQLENFDIDSDQIEIGTLVVNNARVGIVVNKTLFANYTELNVLNLRVFINEKWFMHETKIFKGKLIMEQ